MSTSVSTLSTSKIFVCAVGLIFGLVGNTHASVISVATGYEVSYQFDMGGIPRNGNDIQDTFIFEWNENGDFNVDYGFTIAGRGSTNISHIISFEPTAAFLIGYGLGDPDFGDGKDHLFTFVNSSFAYEAAGHKWSEVFPGVPPEPRIGHNAMIELLAEAVGGDLTALNSLTNFVKNEAYQGAFDPAGSFKVVEWSRAVIPEPITFALFSIGLAGLGWSRRKKS